MYRSIEHSIRVCYSCSRYATACTPSCASVLSMASACPSCVCVCVCVCLVLLVVRYSPVLLYYRLPSVLCVYFVFCGIVARGYATAVVGVSFACVCSHWLISIEHPTSTMEIVHLLLHACTEAISVLLWVSVRYVCMASTCVGALRRQIRLDNSDLRVKGSGQSCSPVHCQSCSVCGRSHTYCRRPLTFNV